MPEIYLWGRQSYGRKKMEKSRSLDDRLDHGRCICDIRYRADVCVNELCQQRQHHAGCTPTVGESLPDLDVGYTSDNCEVMIPSNDKYDIVSAKWSSTKNDVKIGGTYTMKITLKTLNDYKFSSSSYTSSKVKVKNGTFVSASRSSATQLVVTVKTKPAKGDLDAPGEAYWQTTKSGSSDLGLAKWEAVEDASYEAYLYRGSKVVHKSGEVHVSNYDFFPYMTSKGTYTFRVRSLPSNDEVSKYASKSEWTVSDEVYIEQSDADRAAKKKPSNMYVRLPNANALRCT